MGLGFGLACATTLAADPAASLQDFQLGQKYQAAHQWGNAAKQFLKALQDDPKAYWSYKALGTIYYQAGDHRGALVYYQRYLALNPSDSATQAFATRLRTELGVAGPAAPAATASAAPAGPSGSGPTSHGGFGVRIGGDMVLNNGADVKTLASMPGFSPPEVTGSNAIGYGLSADYTTDGGFMTGIDAMEGPSRSYTVTYAGVSGSEQFAFTNQTFGLNAGWRLGFGSHFMVEPNLGLDYMLSSLKISNPVFSGTFTASGFAAWPRLRAEFVWGCFGVGLSAGYLWAQLSPVDDNGSPIKQTNSDGSTSTWVMNNGGVSIGIYAAYHFTPPL
jgi:hypothetical protein